MKGYVTMAGAVLALSAASAAEKTKPIYIPTVIAYMNGDFVNMSVAAPPMDNMKDCLAKVESLIGQASQRGEIPVNGSVIGACIPAPRHFITAPLT